MKKYFAYVNTNNSQRPLGKPEGNTAEELLQIILEHRASERRGTKDFVFIPIQVVDETGAIIIDEDHGENF